MDSAEGKTIEEVKEGIEKRWGRNVTLDYDGQCDVSNVFLNIQEGGTKGVSYNSDTFTLWHYFDKEAAENFKRAVNIPTAVIDKAGVTLDSRKEAEWLIEKLQSWLDGETSDDNL